MMHRFFGKGKQQSNNSLPIGCSVAYWSASLLIRKRDADMRRILLAKIGLIKAKLASLNPLKYVYFLGNLAYGVLGLIPSPKIRQYFIVVPVSAIVQESLQKQYLQNEP